VKPTVLIVTTAQWFPTVRLAMALSRSGFVVKTVCPSRHPVFKTKVIQESYHYHGLWPLMSIANAINKAQADLIIPGDDLATQHLHRLHERESLKGRSKSALCSLIERSLGSAASFPIAYSRISFMDIAREEGVRVPETSALKNNQELRDWIARVGLPVVLKANGTSGGAGVRIARTAKESERAFRELQAPPLLARAVKRTLLDQDPALLLPAILSRKFTISAQKFINGTEATSAIACWNGRVVAALHFEVVNKKHAAGHSTVVRAIENAEMTEATTKLARCLNLSGLHGFDFMLEAGAGDAYVIEINPRATQVGHLALGAGRDIPAALFSAVSGQAIQVAPAVTEKDTIALFPQEWIRDSASAYLRSAYHDVPWEEPELVRACIRSRKKRQPWRVERRAWYNVSEVRVPRT
jgi:carbamoylphosphate synthase large subunit